MDMGGGHDMGGMMAPPPSPAAGGAHAGGGMGMGMHMRYTHMTFFWGKNSEILFTGWPGANGGMYALALVAVFTLAFVLEFLGSRRLDALLPSAAAGNGRRAAAGAVARAAVYAVRTCSCSRSCRSTAAFSSSASRATPRGSWRSRPACSATAAGRRWRTGPTRRRSSRRRAARLAAATAAPPVMADGFICLAFGCAWWIRVCVPRAIV
ncbi:unnamed protein product [Urochloa humidicola]